MILQKLMLVSTAVVVGSSIALSPYFFGKTNATIQPKALGIASQSSAAKEVHPARFFDGNLFFSGVTKANAKGTPFSYQITGGIVPHHLFASDLLADFFQRLSDQNPQTVILIGPNHREAGNFKALSSMYAWATPFGNILPNESIIKQLTEKNLIQIDEAVIANDHAVAGLMPFVKLYLPNTVVVPILLSNFMTLEDTNVLADALEKHVSTNTVLIAAVDFSHYLPNQQAQEKDAKTLLAINSFDYRTLLSFNNDYLDGSRSIAVLLQTMQHLGTTKFEILHHTNSGELQKNDAIETTSYLVATYH